eukprot:CAMPEP_0172506314 /NCGR_PEP_ID=MMETSP1066-20121228/193941_1 /TAXON_ID=671091 /ORGANISM="Coscinodiscus wailesii, Strain CCMP2513" /LENGTH=58 /DNA_ID=CAMNT_0013283293 /DNA_START=188 /DNA_END=361 /DNA_ORIENTATION=+
MTAAWALTTRHPRHRVLLSSSLPVDGAVKDSFRAKMFGTLAPQLFLDTIIKTLRPPST